MVFRIEREICGCTRDTHNDGVCRYEVIKASGKGVFSNVVTATDKLRQNSEGVNPLVAIKVIRANDTMYKAGKLELQILTCLAEADPDNRRHVIRLLRSFEYRHHLCMVRSSVAKTKPSQTGAFGLGTNHHHSSVRPGKQRILKRGSAVACLSMVSLRTVIFVSTRSSTVAAAAAPGALGTA